MLCKCIIHSAVDDGQCKCWDLIKSRLSFVESMVGCKRKRQHETSETGQSDEDCSCSDDEYEYGSSSSKSSSSSSSSYSDASSTSESDSSESVSAELPLAKLANLSFNCIFLADEDASSSEDMYQRRGKCKARLNEVAKQKCCKGRCKRNLKPIWKSVCYLVGCFWALTKQGQDGLLWSLQNPMFIPQTQEDESNDESDDPGSSIEKHSPRIQWQFEGALV